MWLAAWSSCLDFTTVVDCHLELWAVKLQFSPELLFSQSILFWPQKWNQGHGIHSHTFRGFLNFSYDCSSLFFLLSTSECPVVRICHRVCMHLLEGPLGFCQVWTTMMKAVASICVWGFSRTSFSAHVCKYQGTQLPGYMRRTFSFVGNCQIVFQSGCTVLHFHHQSTDFLLSQTPQHLLL